MDEENPENDPVQSLIAEILDAESRGESVDQVAFVNQHPEHADSLREFFANHDSMKGGGAEDATIPPAQTTGEDATLPASKTQAHSQAKVGDKVRYFGDYELLEEIARGGMGVVYKARQVSLNRIVAVKMILSGHLASEEDIQRFRTEAEAAASLDHVGIVPIYQVGQHDGQHFFSMRFVDGQSLAECLQEGPLDVRLATTILRQLCVALAVAHDQGVVHRDLKPANILIDDSQQPKITDFGLAKDLSTESGLTGTGQLLGTPSYMSPEQANGAIREIGVVSDIYSLGAVLYCMMTGRPPFQASSPIETLRLVRESEPVSPRRLNPSIPVDLETICLKCLRKSFEDRYASARDLEAELARFWRGEPIKARPVGAVERGWRWCKRNPVVATLSAIASVSLIAGSIISLYFGIRAEQAAAKARMAQGEAEDGRTAAVAQRRIAEARTIETKNALYDLTTTFGLAADSQGKRSQALLWFANAANSAPDGSMQQSEGLLRMQMWRRQLANPVRTFSSDGETPVASMFDSTGRFLAILTNQKTCRVWELDQESPIQLLEGVESISWHPAELRLAVAIDSGPAKILNVATGRFDKLPTSNEQVTQVAFSPDGASLALAGTRVQLLELSSGSIRESEPLDSDTIYLEFATSGDSLLSLQDDYQVRVFTTHDLHQTIPSIPHRYTVHDREIQVFPHFVQGGKGILTRTGVLTWSDASTGAPIRVIEIDAPSINGVAVSPDQQRFAIAAQSSRIHLWDCHQQREVATQKLEGTTAWAPVFSPDGLEVSIAAGNFGVQRFARRTEQFLKSVFQRTKAISL